MNAFAILAFVLAPILAVGLGLATMVLHGHEAGRLDRQLKADGHP